MTAFSTQPGGRLLWCLRRRKSDVRCLIFPGAMPIEIHVLQDRDIVLTELFQEEWLAIDWARVYGERLKAQGWRESPDAEPS